jgi:hypothetical protein
MTSLEQIKFDKTMDDIIQSLVVDFKLAKCDLERLDANLWAYNEIGILCAEHQQASRIQFYVGKYEEMRG